MPLYELVMITILICFAASKEQLAKFISSLHGHVASLLRQMVGSLGMITQSCLNYIDFKIVSVLMVNLFDVLDCNL